jgi:hypothetical protein
VTGPGDGGEPPAPAGSASGRVIPHPAAFHDGQAHFIRWANPAFHAVFGAGIQGLPAREAMTGLSRRAFDLMDRVLREGRPLAMRVTMPVGERRLVVVPRKDVETGETHGVTTHLREPGER